MTTPSESMLNLARNGFEQALVRVRNAPAVVAASLYVPLTEAVWWAVCVDDALEETTGYKNRRHAGPCGEILLGMRYARSGLSHHWTHIVFRTGGLTVPFTVPFSIPQVATWIPTSELPDYKGDQTTLRKHYTSSLDGRPVVKTLEAAEQWFRDAR